MVVIVVLVGDEANPKKQNQKKTGLGRRRVWTTGRPSAALLLLPSCCGRGEDDDEKKVWGRRWCPGMCGVWWVVL